MKKFLKENSSVISLTFYAVIALVMSSTGGRDE